MKIQAKDLGSIFEAWIDKVVLPKSNELTKAVIFFLWLQNKEQLSGHMEKLAPMLGADSDKTIDLDKTYNNAKLALDKAGGSVVLPWINWRLDGDDLETLFSIARDKAR